MGVPSPPPVQPGPGLPGVLAPFNEGRLTSGLETLGPETRNSVSSPPPPGPGPTLLLTYIAFQFVASSFVPRISYLTYMVRASVSPSSSASCPPHPPTWPRPAPGKLHRPPPPITWRVSGPWREGAGGGRGSSTPWHPAGLAGVSFSRVPHPFKATREGASDLHPAPISKFCFTKSNRGNPTSVKQPTSPPPSPHVSPVRMRAGRVPLLRLSPPTHYMAALPVTSASSTGPYHSCFARSPPPAHGPVRRQVRQRGHVHAGGAHPGELPGEPAAQDVAGPARAARSPPTPRQLGLADTGDFLQTSSSAAHRGQLAADYF